MYYFTLFCSLYVANISLRLYIYKSIGAAYLKAKLSAEKTEALQDFYLCVADRSAWWVC